MQGKTDFTYINFDNDFAGNYNNTILTAPSPLSLDGFPAGVLHLTVFDEKEQPLAQRLVYLQRTRDRLTPTLNRDTGSLEPHGRNSFHLEIPGDAAGVSRASTATAAPCSSTPSSQSKRTLSVSKPNSRQTKSASTH